MSWSQVGLAVGPACVALLGVFATLALQRSAETRQAERQERTDLERVYIECIAAASDVIVAMFDLMEAPGPDRAGVILSRVHAAFDRLNATSAAISLKAPDEIRRAAYDFREAVKDVSRTVNADHPDVDGCRDRLVESHDRMTEAMRRKPARLQAPNARRLG